MDFMQLAKERHSVRKFSDKKVEKEKLDLILKAGQLAPTAVNYQPQRILVIESDEALSKLKTCTPYHFNAPMALLVCYDPQVSWKSPKGTDMGVVDASIVTSHMMLETANLGLGSTWVGHFDPDLIKEQLQIPDYLKPVVLLPIGYPAQDSVPHPMHTKRYELEETVFYNNFDGIVKGESTAGLH